MPRECTCGSGEERYEIRDARGIFVAFACSRCEAEKKRGYRDDIFTDSNYWADERIEDDY